MSAASCQPGAGRTSAADSADLALLNFVETASVGGADATGVSAIGLVRGATLLPGTDLFIIADGSSQVIHYFTRSGEYRKSVGGRGGGPSESQAIGKVWGLPDGGFCTWDLQSVRVTRFDATGAVRHTGHADLTSIEAMRPTFVGFLDDCSFVLRDQREIMGMKTEPEGLGRDTLRFVMFDSVGAAIRPLANDLDAETWFRNRDGGWGRVVPILGSEHFSFVAADRLWLAVSDSLRWTRVHTRTGLIDTLSYPADPTPTTLADVEAERSRLLDAVTVPRRPGLPLPEGDNPLERLAEGRRSGIRVAPSSRFFPAFDRALAGSDGTVWVREYPHPEAPDAAWLMIGADGMPWGRLRLPRSTELLSASGDWLLTLTLDEWDAPVVHVLRRVGDEALLESSCRP